MELRTKSLCLDRGSRTLVRGLTIEVRPAETWVVLGPNGAGKSSLLLALAGQLHPCGGEVWLDGSPLSQWSSRERARRVAWLGNLPPTEFGMTVAERLALAQDRRDRVAVARTLERFDLTGAQVRRLEDLSAGERQRVELAALWLRDAPLWLVDEPTAHLDLRHQVHCVRELERVRRNGRSLLIVLHDLTQARALADWAVLLFGDGRVAAEPANELLRPEVLRSLFGTEIESFASGRNAAPALLPAYGSNYVQRET